MKAEFKQLGDNRLQIVITTQDEKDVLLLREYLREQHADNAGRFMIISEGGTESVRTISVGSYENKVVKHTTMTREELRRLARLILNFDENDPTQGGERPVCLRCNGEYVLGVGDEPTPLCDGCAHATAIEFAEIVEVAQ